jgi:hypothetical protein
LAPAELVGVVAGRGLCPAHAALRPLALASGAAGEAIALRGVSLVAVLGVPGGGRAQLEIAGPAAAVFQRGVADLVELEDACDRALEEGAVVRDDHGAAGALRDEALQPCQAVEVEVVGRLVEQQDVEAGEQDRGERRARGLATGERHRLQVEQGGIQPEVAQDRLGALLQVGATEREPRLERAGVALRGAGRIRRQLVRGGSQRLRVCDAGAPREVMVQPLAGRAVGLLRR